MEKATIFKLVEVEMKDIKKGDQFFSMRKYPTTLCCDDGGGFINTALEDAKVATKDPKTQEDIWSVKVKPYNTGEGVETNG